MTLKIGNRCITCKKEFQGRKSQYCSMDCEMLEMSCKAFPYRM